MVDRTVEGFGLSHAAILDGLDGSEETFGDIYGVRTGTIAADVGNYDNTGDDFVLSSWFWINFATVTIEAGYVPFETMALLSGDHISSTGVSSIEFTPNADGDYSGTAASYTVGGTAVSLNQDYGSVAGVRSAVDAALGSGYYVTRRGDNIRIESTTASATPITANTALTNATGYVNTPGSAAGDEVFSMPLWSEQSVNQPPRPMLIRIPSKDKLGVVRTLDFVLYRVQFGPFNFTGPAYRSGLLLNYSGRAVLSAVDEQGNTIYDRNGCATRAIGRLINSPASTVC